MKTVSQKDLDRLVKKGWQFTPDSKKVVSDSKMASTLTKSLEAIRDLARAAEGIEQALLDNKRGGDKGYLDIISKLTESIKNIQVSSPIQPTETINRETRGRRIKFVVRRNQEGVISEVESIEV